MFKYYQKFREYRSSSRQNQSLLVILRQASSQDTLKDKALWLKSLIRWLSTPMSTQAQTTDHPSQNIRLKLLINLLRDNPEFQKSVTELITSLFKQVDPLDFFSDMGLVDSHSFFHEVLLRIGLRYLPEYKDYSKLSVLANEVFASSQSTEWMKNLGTDQLKEAAALLSFDDAFKNEVQTKYINSLIQAEKIIAVRLASLSSDPEFRNRVRQADRLLLIEIGENRPAEILNRANRITEKVYQSLEYSGVSIELVFLLERIRALLNRLNLLNEAAKNTKDHMTHLLLITSILNAQQDRGSILGFLSSNLKLISKKITERAGITGEHYIARTPKEYRSLFNSAAGGGLITTFTTVLKSMITKLGLPLFAEGFLAWVNYAFSFMIIQASHCTLATKTPAMTASVLAAKLRDVDSTDDQSEFLQEVRHIFKSGFLAILGNVFFVMAGAFLIDLIILKTKGEHFLSNESAVKYLENHHLFTSLTVWYAIYTGMALWFGSALGGWFENWYTYRGLPHAVEESKPLQAVFGLAGAKKFSKWLSHSIMGIATNIALGFLLAFTTIFGKFFGIPLDVRHVTLSSGAIGLSLSAIENIREHLALVVYSLSGLFFIGVLNFGVSFFISLLVAAQAKDVQLKHYPELFKKIIFLRRLKN